jgi:hypothetical protein
MPCEDKYSPWPAVELLLVAPAGIVIGKPAETYWKKNQSVGLAGAVSRLYLDSFEEASIRVDYISFRPFGCAA